MSSGRFYRSIKGILRLIRLVSVLWLFSVGVSASNRSTKTTMNSHDNNQLNVKHDQVKHEVVTVGRGKLLAARSKVDFNYMSKRKVPNGPDPIHNRRAGNSRRPPGQS